LNNLLPLFANNLLPIFLMAGIGYLLGKYLGVDVKSLNRACFYVFSPALIFNLLVTSELKGNDILRMVGFTLVFLVLIGLIAWGVGKVFGFDRKIMVAVIITAMLTNAGNYGLSANQFAFGDVALAYASLFYITNALMAYTGGVFVVSLGKSDIKQALLNLFKVPSIYAVVVAILVLWLDLTLPLPIARTSSVLAGAAIPCMLMVLGLQMQRVNGTTYKKALTTAVALRMVVAPLVGIALAVIFGLQGAARQAGVMEAAMPPAVMTTVLATEYDVEPEFVTVVVFTATILSPLTLTPLMAILGGS